MACLSWYIDVQYLADDAPLLSSLPEAYSQFLLSRFSLYHTLRFSVAFSPNLVLEVQRDPSLTLRMTLSDRSHCKELCFSIELCLSIR